MKNRNKVILIIIAVIITIVSIGLYSKYRAFRERLVCPTNLRALGIAMAAYADNHNDKWPDKDQWCDLLLKNTEITPKNLRCPAEWKGPCNYSINADLPIHKKDTPDNLVLLFESTPSWNQSGDISIFNPQRLTTYGGYVLFADGYVEFVEADNIPSTLSE